MENYRNILRETREDDIKFSWKQISKAMAMDGASSKTILKLLSNLNKLGRGTKGKVAGYGGKPKWDLFKNESEE